LLADPAADAGALDGLEVDAVLLRELAHQRGDIRRGTGLGGSRRLGPIGDAGRRVRPAVLPLRGLVRRLTLRLGRRARPGALLGLAGGVGRVALRLFRRVVGADLLGRLRGGVVGGGRSGVPRTGAGVVAGAGAVADDGEGRPDLDGLVFPGDDLLEGAGQG